MPKSWSEPALSCGSGPAELEWDIPRAVTLQVFYCWEVRAARLCPLLLMSILFVLGFFSDVILGALLELGQDRK